MIESKKIKKATVVYSEKYENLNSKILNAEKNCKILSEELVKNKIKYEILNKNHAIYLVINRREYDNATRLLLMTGLDFFIIYYENHNKEII